MCEFKGKTLNSLSHETIVQTYKTPTISLICERQSHALILLMWKEIDPFYVIVFIKRTCHHHLHTLPASCTESTYRFDSQLTETNANINTRPLTVPALMSVCQNAAAAAMTNGHFGASDLVSRVKSKCYLTSLDHADKDMACNSFVQHYPDPGSWETSFSTNDMKKSIPFWHDLSPWLRLLLS